MNKIILLFTLLLAGATSFAQQQEEWCATDQFIDQQIQANPSLQSLYHEAMIHATRFVDRNANSRMAAITVPVVIHVIHDNGNGNISNAQIQSALDILNLDYNRLNADAGDTRNTATAPFEPNAGDMDIEFKLAKIDPDGNCTNGIVRVNAPELTYGAGESCKYSSNGGSDQWPKDEYFNIWVVNSIEGSGGGTTLGYAYLPYGANNNSGYGILIRNDTFGSIETAQGSDGRTLTHEMGHALGLLHIFDEGFGGNPDGCHTGSCNENGDYSCDTPPQQEANWSCSQTWNSCTNVPIDDDYGFDALDQIENYMSYNSCQNMFSADQVNIMQNNFTDIGFMSSMIENNNLIATGVNDPDILCKSEFDASQTSICTNTTIDFTDLSYHGPTTWTWSVSPGTEGVDYMYVNGTDASSQNPSIQFIGSGNFDITLEVSDGVTNATETKSNFVHVLPESADLPIVEGFESYVSVGTTENWSTYNSSSSSNNNTFEIYDGAAHSGSRCVRLLNFGQTGENSDELISAPVDLSVVDTANSEIVTLSFRYSYRKRYDSNDEWLKVFISNDCGGHWAQRKTIHGNSLSSIAQNSSWTPSSQDDWTTVHMTNVTPLFFTENFQYKFEFEGMNGNNFYLDDINIYKGSPSDEIVGLEAIEGFIQDVSIYPNPADEAVNVRFNVAHAASVDLAITDLTGKKISQNTIHAANGSNLVLVDTDTLSNGVYFLRLSIGGVESVKQFIIR